MKFIIKFWAMIEDIYESIYDNLAVFAIGLIVILSIFAVVLIAIERNQEYNNFFQQCIEDGHKPYECRSMLRGCRR